jgi:ParB-like chromosome segregation protein Spo0J
MGKQANAAAAAEPEVAAAWVPMDQLHAWDRNPRVNDHVVDAVAGSVIRFGFGNPILARQADGELIAGHTRVKSARVLVKRWAEASPTQRVVWQDGPDDERWNADAIRIATRREVPARFMVLSEREAHLLALADNRLSEKAQWDAPELHAQLVELDQQDMEMAGWSAEELDALGKSVVGAEDGEFPELPDGEPEHAQITFTLSRRQKLIVEEALQAAKDSGKSDVADNDNSNGNALALICEAYCGQR